MALIYRVAPAGSRPILRRPDARSRAGTRPTPNSEAEMASSSGTDFQPAIGSAPFGKTFRVAERSTGQAGCRSHYCSPPAYFGVRAKLELIYRRDFASQHQARVAIFDYSEAFYNRERLHSALNFLSPTAFELINN